MTQTTRRRFLQTALGATALPLGANAGADETRTQRVTLAQIHGSRDVKRNMKAIRRGFEQARKDKAGWVHFPEGALSGYWGGFKQDEVSKAFEEIRDLCRHSKIIALIGTCWQEGAAKPHNEIRIVDAKGNVAGIYAKTCLTYGDARQYAPGGFPLTHRIGGLRIGTLICNDLWVTPGFTDGPNPHLTLKMARAGAHAIFQAVSSGGQQKYREYHESNLKLRSAEAKCPIVVVNSAVKKGKVNCASGVVNGFEYSVMLPRAGEAIQTVEFTPARRT